MSIRLKNELNAFKNLWVGGYFEGNPLDPLSVSSYGKIGYMSVLYAAYLVCIKPYVHQDSKVVEIGPGRGCWTKAILNSNPNEVWCLDALSAEHNQFWEYLNNPKNVKYFQVHDFLCKDLPDDYFDYLFSFGCFNHISPMGLEEYVKNLYPKLKPGAHAFIMFADYDKYNGCIDKYDQLNISSRTADGFISKLKSKAHKSDLIPHSKQEGMDIEAGRFYHNGIDNVVCILNKYGYQVLQDDCMANHRDPIVHFTKMSR